jgi:hypothetical protein
MALITFLLAVLLLESDKALYFTNYSEYCNTVITCTTGIMNVIIVGLLFYRAQQ